MNPVEKADAGPESAVTSASSQASTASPKSLAQARSSKGAGALFLAAIEPLLSAESPRLTGAVLRADTVSVERATETSLLRPSVKLSGSSVTQGESLTISQPVLEFGKRSARLQRLASQENVQLLQLADTRQTLASQALIAVLTQDFASKWISLTKTRIFEFRKAKCATDGGSATEHRKRFAAG